MRKYFLFFHCVAFIFPAHSFQIRWSSGIEPTFYSTGDYQAITYSGSIGFFPHKNIGVDASYSQFHYNNDKVVFFNDIRSKVWCLAVVAKSSPWRRQSVGISFGAALHHKRSDETFLIRGAKDSASTLRFIGHYFETAREVPGTDVNKFRLRAKIVDSTGYYEVGISEVRNYTLKGIAASLLYEVNPVQKLWLQLIPKCNWYPSEPLFIWSLGIGISIPFMQ